MTAMTGRSWFLATLAAISTLSQDSGAENLDPQPTELESFALQRGSRIVSVLTIGSLEVPPTNLTVATVIVQSSYGEIAEMRGVRLELRNGRHDDTLYLDENQVLAVKRSIRTLRLEEEPAFSTNGAPEPLRVARTTECRQPKLVLHTLCPEMYSSEEGAGLRIHALRGVYYWFPGNEPEKLGALLGKALLELQQQLNVQVHPEITSPR